MLEVLLASFLSAAMMMLTMTDLLQDQHAQSAAFALSVGAIETYRLRSLTHFFEGTGQSTAPIRDDIKRQTDLLLPHWQVNIDCNGDGVYHNTNSMPSCVLHLIAPLSGRHYDVSI